MARNINLLPPELSPKKIYSAIGRKIRTISIIGYIILIITIAVSAIGFLIFSRQFNEATERQKQLESELTNLKKSEAKIVILKDRAQKSKEVFDSNLTRVSVDSFNKFRSQTPEGIQFDELSLEGSKITLTAKAINSQNLENFINDMISSKIFNIIYLTELTLDSSGVYTLSFEIEI